MFSRSQACAFSHFRPLASPLFSPPDRLPIRPATDNPFQLALSLIFPHVWHFSLPLRHHCIHPGAAGSSKPQLGHLALPHARRSGQLRQPAALLAGLNPKPQKLYLATLASPPGPTGPESRFAALAPPQQKSVIINPACLEEKFLTMTPHHTGSLLHLALQWHPYTQPNLASKMAVVDNSFQSHFNLIPFCFQCQAAR